MIENIITQKELDVVITQIQKDLNLIYHQLQQSSEIILENRDRITGMESHLQIRPKKTLPIQDVKEMDETEEQEDVTEIEPEETPVNDRSRDSLPFTIPKR